MNLSVALGRMVLENPVVLSSGTCGYGREISPFVDLNCVGALTVKGLSLFPWEGNSPPRLFEVRAGVLNSIGLENKGVEKFLKEDLPFLESLKTRVFVNIWGRTQDEYVKVAQILDKVDRVDALEVNVSCPNVEKGGVFFSSDLLVLQKLLGSIRSVTRKFLIVKLGPQVKDWETAVRYIEGEGVEAISLTNSFPALVIDVERMGFIFSLKSAGLSGPAIKPVALKMVYDLVGVTRLPVIGMGGIMTAEDALEFLLVGARAIGLGTCNLVCPSSAATVLEGIKAYLLRKNVENLQEIIGRVR